MGVISSEAWRAIATLGKLEAWKRDNRKDVTMMKKIEDEFPRAPILEVANKYLENKRGKELGNFRLEFRNWCKKNDEWKKEKINESKQNATPEKKSTDDIPDWRKELELDGS